MLLQMLVYANAALSVYLFVTFYLLSRNSKTDHHMLDPSFWFPYIKYCGKILIHQCCMKNCNFGP